MTNTIPNVPRELLDSLLTVIESNGYAADEVEVVDELRALLSAPSPAGVDGLEVVGYSYGNGILINDTTQPDNPMYTKLVRLSEAQAIIDGLRGEVAELQTMLATVSKAGLLVRNDRDQQAQRIGALAFHLEFAVTLLTVAGLAGNAQVEAMRAALSAGNEPNQCT